MNDSTPKKPTQHAGRPVEAIKFKVSGSAPLEDLAGQEVEIDDRIQLMSIYTVTNVSYGVDPATGNLVKTQTIKPVEMHLIPFDENDPDDDGILRAMLPGVVVSNVPSIGAGDAEGDDE